MLATCQELKSLLVPLFEKINAAVETIEVNPNSSFVVTWTVAGKKPRKGEKERWSVPLATMLGEMDSVLRKVGYKANLLRVYTGTFTVSPL